MNFFSVMALSVFNVARPDDVLVVVLSPTGGTRYSPTFQECEDIVRSVLDAQVCVSL